MLRRILSPKPKAQGGQFVDTKPRSQSSSSIHFNGHLEEGEEVKNLSYGDPDTFHAPARSQSMVTTPTREMNPPLPPRNLRPPSFSNMESESSVYVAPADTLRNRPLANSSPHPSAASSAAGSNETSSATVDPEAQPTRSERKVMQMHQLTMNQRRGQGGVATPVTATTPSNGHRRSGSIGTVTEKSDYSVPFDLRTEPPRSVRPPLKPPRVAPPTRHESSDCIIPINPPSSTSPQPPSDRSDTNSPSSPMSNQSSEHEQPRQDDGDYAVPWDRNKLFQNIRVRRGPQGKSFRNDDSGFSEDTTHRLQSDREFVQLRTEEQKPPSKEYSPPPPARGGLRYQFAREPMVGVEVSPPPPDLPYDPRPHRNRGMSDRVHRRDGSTSPVGGGGVSRGEDMRFYSQSASYMGRNPPPPPSRLDPPQERGWGDSSPLPPPRDHSVREDTTGKGQVMIDVSIPLKDQP